MHLQSRAVVLGVVMIAVVWLAVTIAVYAGPHGELLGTADVRHSEPFESLTDCQEYVARRPWDPTEPAISKKAPVERCVAVMISK